jgi:hypothetical protein
MRRGHVAGPYFGPLGHTGRDRRRIGRYCHHMPLIFYGSATGHGRTDHTVELRRPHRALLGIGTVAGDRETGGAAVLVGVGGARRVAARAAAGLAARLGLGGLAAQQRPAQRVGGDQWASVFPQSQYSAVQPARHKGRTRQLRKHAKLLHLIRHLKLKESQILYIMRNNINIMRRDEYGHFDLLLLCSCVRVSVSRAHIDTGRIRLTQNRSTNGR